MLKAYTTYTVSLLALLLTGCAHETYTRQPLKPVDSAEAFRARTLTDAGLGDVGEWDLPRLTQAALRLHPDLATARMQWKAAQAAEVTAGQKPNPTVSGGGEHHSRASNVSPWTFTLGIDIPIETHGKREARLEQATALTQAAKLDIAQTAWQVRSRVRAKLLDLYTIRQQTAQLQKEVTIRRQIVNLLEARLKAGLVSGTDLADARLQLQQNQVALEAESARATEARAALAASIGISDTALDNIAFAFPSFEQDSEISNPAGIQRAALLNRLEIRKALANYDAAEARLKLEIARQYPDFSLAPGYSWDQGDNRWSLGLSLVLAFLNKNEGPIAEARAQRDLQAQQFNALQASVIGEQTQALAAWEAARIEIERVSRLTPSLHDRYDQIQRQFDAGYADRLELTTARLEVVTAESAVLDARLKAQRALGALEDAVQQPLDGSAPLPVLPEEEK